MRLIQAETSKSKLEEKIRSRNRVETACFSDKPKENINFQAAKRLLTFETSHNRDVTRKSHRESSHPPWDRRIRIGQAIVPLTESRHDHRPGQHLVTQTMALEQAWSVLTSSVPGLTVYISELSLLISEVIVRLKWCAHGILVFLLCTGPWQQLLLGWGKIGHLGT